MAAPRLRFAAFHQPPAPGSVPPRTVSFDSMTGECPLAPPTPASTQVSYSGNSSPEPPISFGKSLIFGSPSLTLSTFSP